MRRYPSVPKCSSTCLILLKGKGKETYSSLQASLPSPLRELTCHMGSHSVTCHPAEVTLPPLPPAEAGTRFSDPGGMQGWVDLGGWLERWFTHMVTHHGTNRARCWLTSLVRPTTLTTTPSRHPLLLTWWLVRDACQDGLTRAVQWETGSIGCPTTLQPRTANDVRNQVAYH